MKLRLLLLSLLAIHAVCKAQTWDEWFKQKKTQIKYLEEQIIALQIFGNYLQEGYKVVQGGLSAIQDIKNGDFTLHNDYFSSLNSVNTAILNNSKTTDVINLQLNILQLNKMINKELSNISIRNNERLYIKQVMQNILQQCAANIIDLTNLNANGKSQMKDDERVKRINSIYEEMKDKYTFTSHLKEQVEMVALLRQKESNGIGILQSMYGLK